MRVWGGGGGGKSNCNASLSQPSVQKKQQSPCEGVGGLKNLKKNAGKKTIKSTPQRFPRHSP